MPRAAGGEGRGTNARFGELRKKRLRCSEKKPMCYSGIHRTERNPRHLKDGISESSGPRPPYSRWRLPSTLKNPCPLAHSVARSLRLESGISTSKRKGSIGCWGKGEKRERRGGRHSRAFSMLLHPIHSPRRKTSQSLTDVLLVNANARKESPSGREQEQRGSTPSPTSKMTTTTERIGFLSPILYRYWKIDASLALSLSLTHISTEKQRRGILD